jgi:hypothetical protein
MRLSLPPLIGGLLRLALVGALVAFITPMVRAQGQPAIPSPQPTSFTYRDADGVGQLLMQDLGPDQATGGHQIKITLTQNGVTYLGSGISLPLEATPPFTTLLTFSLVSPARDSYFFQGKTISGITLSGQGTYHVTGIPEQKASWSIVLGGGAGGGGGTTGPSAIRGVAMAGPIRPVEQPGVPNTAPLPFAIITVQPAGGGAEISRTVADSSGRFQIPIAPGTYLIVPLPPQPGAIYPRGIPQTVAVQPGGFTEVVVQYDTGIR